MRQYKHFEQTNDTELVATDFLGIDKVVQIVCDAFTAGGTDEAMYVLYLW